MSIAEPQTIRPNCRKNITMKVGKRDRFLGRLQTGTDSDRTDPFGLQLFKYLFPVRVELRKIQVRVDVKIFEHRAFLDFTKFLTLCEGKVPPA